MTEELRQQKREKFQRYLDNLSAEEACLREVMSDDKKKEVKRKKLCDRTSNDEPKD